MTEPGRRFTTGLAILAVVIASSGGGAVWAANLLAALANNVYMGWRPATYQKYMTLSWALLYFSAGAFPGSVLLSFVALFRRGRHSPPRPLLPILALLICLLAALPLLFEVWASGQ